MTLTVEDGSRVTGANSYVSIADADAYHAARGNSSWTGEDTAKEAAILRAMAWLESRPWKGRPYSGPVGFTGYQALQWPRVDVELEGYAVPWDEIPQGVVNALCEAALVEIGSPGALAPELERGGQVRREKVDVIETEFFAGAPAVTVYAALNQHLRGLVRGGGSVKLVRG